MDTDIERKGLVELVMRKKSNIYKGIRPYGTYETDNAWVTPLGEYNIIHEDCPTDSEIRQRVKDVMKEILDEAVEKSDCPLCEMMKGQAYNIVYYCTTFCHKCKKAKRCKNFNPYSREEEEEIIQVNEKLDRMSEEEMIKELGMWLEKDEQGDSR